VAALDLPAPEREPYITSQTPGDPTVADEVLRLLRLHELADDFLEAPAVGVATEVSFLLADGEVVADRFEVVRALGRGGMGEVYEAWDRVLNDCVAIKVMRGSTADAEHLAAKFRQEVQLARRITHRGVCRVHDVAFHLQLNGQPLVVLTMELLSGETLADRLAREPLDRPEALRIITEIADALDAAHAQQVVHGDIKPENVFLATGGDGRTRALLTDFGLARALGSEPGAGPSGAAFLGTPAYMAPELFAGQEVSVASDVYAFALVAYRLISGGGELWPTDADLPTIPSGVRLLGATARRALTGALDADPARRYPSAGAMVHALLGTARRRRQRQAAQAAGILAVTVALVMALVSLTARINRRQSSEIGVSPLVLVTTTSNKTGEERLDGVTEVLRSQLAQSSRFETFGPDRIIATLAQMRRDPATALTRQVAREVALREGATLVVYSSVKRAGSGYALEVELERLGADPTDVRDVWRGSFAAAERADLFAAARASARWIRTTVGEPSGTISDHDRPPADTTTSSWEALRVFGKAIETHARGDLTSAAVMLQEAVRLDPEFAGAYMRLGDVLMSLRRDEEAYAAWARAIELGDRRQLTAREHLRLRGQYFEDIGDLARAEQAHRAYVLTYPGDFAAAFFLGSVLRDRGRPQEAVTWLAKAAALRPQEAVGRVQRAATLMELGRAGEAEAEIKALNQAGHVEWAGWLTALATFSRGEIADAVRGMAALRTTTTDPVWVSRAFTLQASFLAEGGDATTAQALLAEGVDFDASQGLRDREAVKWLHRAELFRRAGATRESVAAIGRALSASSDVRTVTQAAVLQCRLGRVAEAQRTFLTLQRQPDVPKTRLAGLRLAGEIALAEGRLKTAVESLSLASAGGRFQQDRLFLVPALQRAGRREEALALLEDWATHPARVYDGPEPEWPGEWAAWVRGYIEALRHAGETTQAETWERRLGKWQAGVTTQSKTTPQTTKEMHQ
jgi:serine/threonine protein kinase/thioredoxin-like negative regulator of GroEL